VFQCLLLRGVRKCERRGTVTPHAVRERACAHALTHHRLPPHTTLTNTNTPAAIPPSPSASNQATLGVWTRGVGGGCLFNGRAEQSAQQCTLHTGVAIYNRGHSVCRSSPFSRQRLRPALDSLGHSPQPSLGDSFLCPSPKYLVPALYNVPPSLILIH
jgi:hypothetical protein